MDARDRAVVIGAGMGGLAAAIRLAALGLSVTVVESAEGPGGKARSLPTVAGPAATGPTVLTWPHLAEELFALAGQRMADRVQMIALPDLARHAWMDGSRLDLYPDAEANVDAIRAFAGSAEAAAFRRFDALASGLLEGLEGPMMLSARPSMAAVAARVLRRPDLWPALRPGLSLEGLLRRQFRDPRLVQLFARYATYVGGRPGLSPAVLALIWAVEAQGVHAIAGGIAALASALESAARALGVRFLYSTRARRIRAPQGAVEGVELEGTGFLPCGTCVFNGDPEALRQGMLGSAAHAALPEAKPPPRSLSAWVWAFAAEAKGFDLAHHNVFFTEDPAGEWGPIGRGQMPTAPTLYVCAQDRLPGQRPLGPERFEIILNAPADPPPIPSEETLCHSRTFPRLGRFGLTLTPEPGGEALLTPAKLARAYPGSSGAIYGQSPEGTLAAFRRPTARTGLAGLYLAGGGAHPGAGVPMAILSGRHAVEMIWTDRISGTSRRPAVMAGGTSTGHPPTDRAPSR